MNNNISNYVLAGFVLLASTIIGLRMMRSRHKAKEKSKLINNNMLTNNEPNGSSRYYYSEEDKI